VHRDFLITLCTEYRTQNNNVPSIKYWSTSVQHTHVTSCHVTAFSSGNDCSSFTFWPWKVNPFLQDFWPRQQNFSLHINFVWFWHHLYFYFYSEGLSWPSRIIARRVLLRWSTINLPRLPTLPHHTAQLVDSMPNHFFFQNFHSSPVKLVQKIAEKGKNWGKAGNGFNRFLLSLNALHWVSPSRKVSFGRHIEETSTFLDFFSVFCE
jgi:hypothetical protein